MNPHRVRLPVFLSILLLLSVPVVSAQTNECVPAPDGLISWWPGDGNALDVANGNDGVLSGGLVLAPGLVDEAFSLNGYDARVSVADDPSLDLTAGVTMEAWIRTDGPAVSTGPVMGKPYPADPRHGYYTAVTSTGQLRCDFWRHWPEQPANGWAIGSGIRVDDSQWHHIACTYDGISVALYVDGVVRAQEPYSNGLATHDQPFYIGLDPVLGGRYFTGLIDEASVYARGLTAGEIETIYQAGSAGKCKDEDGDGFRPPDDCDETDATINPTAFEVPGNFTDENCDGDLGDCWPCMTWKNHGQYVRCVAHAIEDLVVAGNLTEEEGDTLVSSAAQSDIGKKGFVPPACE